MAESVDYNYSLMRQRFDEITEQSAARYDESLMEADWQNFLEQRDAAKSALVLQAGKSIADVGKNLLYNKTSNLLKNQGFSEMKASTFNDARLYTTEPVVPGSELIGMETLDVNPALYDKLGTTLAEIEIPSNFHHTVPSSTGVGPGYVQVNQELINPITGTEDLGALGYNAETLQTSILGRNFVDTHRIIDHAATGFDSSTVMGWTSETQSLLDSGSHQIVEFAANKDLVGAHKEVITAVMPKEVIEQAAELAAAGETVDEAMGLLGIGGKVLAGVGSILSIGSGIHGLMQDDIESQVKGGASLVTGAGGAAAAASSFGLLGTGTTAAAASGVGLPVAVIGAVGMTLWSIVDMM